MTLWQLVCLFAHCMDLTALGYHLGNVYTQHSPCVQCVPRAQHVAAHQFHLAQRGNWPSIDGRGSLFVLRGPWLFVCGEGGDTLAWRTCLK